MKLAEKTKESKNFIPSNHSPCFLKLTKRNEENHLIFKPEFSDFPCKW